MTIGVLKVVISSACSHLVLKAARFQKWYPSSILDLEDFLLSQNRRGTFVWSFNGSRTRPIVSICSVTPDPSVWCITQWRSCSAQPWPVNDECCVWPRSFLQLPRDECDVRTICPRKMSACCPRASHGRLVRCEPQRTHYPIELLSTCCFARRLL